MGLERGAGTRSCLPCRSWQRIWIISEGPKKVLEGFEHDVSGF